MTYYRNIFSWCVRGSQLWSRTKRYLRKTTMNFSSDSDFNRESSADHRPELDEYVSIINDDVQLRRKVSPHPVLLFYHMVRYYVYFSTFLKSVIPCPLHAPKICKYALESVVYPMPCISKKDLVYPVLYISEKDLVVVDIVQNGRESALLLAWLFSVKLRVGDVEGLEVVFLEPRFFQNSAKTNISQISDNCLNGCHDVHKFWS